MTSLPNPSERPTASGEKNGPIARGGACLNCRRRKVKCDGAQPPPCGPCRKVEEDYRKWPQTLQSPPLACVYGPTGTQQPSIEAVPPNLGHPQSRSLSMSSQHSSRNSMGRSASSLGQSSAPLSGTSSRSACSYNFNSVSPLRRDSVPGISTHNQVYQDQSNPSALDFSTVSPIRRPRSSSDQPSKRRRSSQQQPAPEAQQPQSLVPSNAYSTPLGSKEISGFTQGVGLSWYPPGGSIDSSSSTPLTADFPSLVSLGNPESVQSSSGLSASSSIWSGYPSLDPGIGQPYVPPHETLLRLTSNFFFNSSVASILNKEAFSASVGSLASGGTLERSLLHAVLSNSCPFSTAADAQASLFDLEVPLSKIHDGGNRTIAAAHAKRARELIRPHREILGDTEQTFLVSLLLLSHESTLEGGAHAQAEAAWAAVAVRRLAFHDLPILPAGKPFYLLPSISPACTTLWQWQERRNRFWTFFLLDRGIQFKFAFPSFLEEEDIHTTQLQHEGQVGHSISEPIRLKDLSAKHLTIDPRDSSRNLFKACVVLSRTIRYQLRLPRTERDGTAAPSREKIQSSKEWKELSLQAQIVSGIRNFLPLDGAELIDSFNFCGSVTASCATIVLHELQSDYEVLDVSTRTCLSAAQSIASLASKLESNTFNYARCHFQSVTSFWIGGKVLLKRLLSKSVESQERIRLKQDFVRLMVALINYGHVYSHGTFLARSLLALYRNPWYINTPSLWPPYSISHSASKTTDPSGLQATNFSNLSPALSAADLGARIHEEELQRILDNRDLDL